MSELDPISFEMMDALRGAGYRMTRSRRSVVEAIASRRRPFSSAEILGQVSGQEGSVGRATVFRTLDVLQDLGMLERVEHPDGSWGYVACSRGHHHHAICSGCGLVVELRICDVERNAETEATRAGFAIRGHRLEYYGLCSSCQGAPQAVDRASAESSVAGRRRHDATIEARSGVTPGGAD